VTTFNTVSLIVIVVVAALAVIALGIGALLGAARQAQGGPARGSLRRDDDEEQRRA
jgi:hypothetical protein